MAVETAARCSNRAVSDAPFLLLILLAVVAVLNAGSVDAILETAEVSVYLPKNNDDKNNARAGASGGASSAAASDPNYTLLVSQAGFGRYPSMAVGDNPVRALRLPPGDNPLLCENVTSPSSYSGGGGGGDDEKGAWSLSSSFSARGGEGKPSSPSAAALLVPRGGCTFETKAYHAQLLGADAVLIYGTLSSRYSLNETNKTESYRYTEDDIVYPSNYNDYDCRNGRAHVPASSIDVSHPLPYNAAQNDPVLSGGDASRNLCLANDPTRLSGCPSKSCLLTGNKTRDGQKYEACCAWDLHVWLYADDNAFNGSMANAVTIPAVYLTMEQGNRLLNDLKDSADASGRGEIRVVVSARWSPSHNLSSYIVWAVGVAVAALAAYLSADDYHYLVGKVLRRRQRLSEQRLERSDTSSSDQRHHPHRDLLHRRQSPEETMELAPWHAVGFIVMASTSLMILFYFKIYNVVKVLYALGCSKAVSQVLFDPLCKRGMKLLKFKNFVVYATGTEDFGDITARDVISHAIGYALGIAWLVIACTVRHPDTVTYFWVMQDIFGAAMCM